MADDFNYQQQANDIAYRQALAKQFAGAQLPQGQLVNGYFVKPSGLGQLNTVLQQALGAYMNRKALEDQSALDKKDNEIFNNSFDKLLRSGDAANYQGAAEAAVPGEKANLDRFIANNMGRWNAQDSAQASPVGQGNVQGQQLPPMPLPAPAEAAPGPRMLQRGPTPPTAQQIERAVVPADDGTGAVGVMRRPFTQQAPLPASVTTPLVQPQTAPQQPLQAAQPAPQPNVLPAAPQAEQGLVLTPPSPAQPPAVDPGNDFTGVLPAQTDAQLAEERGRWLQRQQQADRLDAMRTLAGTKEGRQLVRNIQGRQLENMLTPKTDEVVKVGEKETLYTRNPRTGAFTKIASAPGAGEMKVDDQRQLIESAYKGVTTQEQLDATNKRLRAAGVSANYLEPNIDVARGIGGQSKVVEDQKAADRGIQTNLEDLNLARNRLLEISGGKNINSATGLTGAAMAALPINTASATFRRTHQDARAQMSNALIAVLRSNGLSASQMNSDSELQQVLRAINGTVDYTRMDPKQIQDEDARLADRADAVMKRLASQRSGATIATPAANRPSSYGQRISGPNDILSGRF